MNKQIDVSYILPSATRDRPPEKWVNKAIDNINEIGKNSKYSYEILVVSEHRVEGENVRWIQDEMKTDGYVAAVNSAIPHANGKYLSLAHDDAWFDENYWAAIDLLEGPIYRRRRLKILSLGTDNGLGSFMPQGYPKYPCIRCVIVAKETIMNYFNGCIFNPHFKHHFADNWLGYWVTLMFDETVIEVWNTTVHIPEGADDPVYGTEGPSYNHNNAHDKAVFDSLVQRLHSGHRSYV
jgi:hypothetical protein